jgi:hypothetical protein
MLYESVTKMVQPRKKHMADEILADLYADRLSNVPSKCEVNMLLDQKLC